MNLLRFSPLRALLGSRYFPLVPQLAMLLGFWAIVAGGMAVGRHPGIAGHLARTNLANQMVWNYWWPGVIILSAILGRVWCAVCPVELVSSVASMLGLKRRVPGIMKSGWVIAVLYGFILFVALRRWHIGAVPRRMALSMIVLSLGVFIVRGFGKHERSRPVGDHDAAVGALRVGFGLDHDPTGGGPRSGTVPEGVEEPLWLA